MNDNQKDNTMPKGRLESIDALRGFDMFFITGGAALLTAIAALLPTPVGSVLAKHMTHASWAASYLYDYIFPTFLFLSGVSWPFSYASQVEKGRTTGQIHRKILWRMTMLILLGWLTLGIMKFDWDHMRLASILGRIGIAWAVAAFIYMHTRIRTQLIVAAAFLVGYWAIIYFIPNPDVALPPGKNPITSWSYCICGWMDRNYLTVAKPGHDGGAFATIGMPVTAMLGMIAGWMLRRTDVDEKRKTLQMLGMAAVLAGLCAAWYPWCPTVKAIWTPTYALLAAAYDFAILAAFHWIIDVKGYRKWAYFGTVIGMNAITIYVLQHFVNFGSVSRMFLSGIAGLFSEEVGKVIICAGRVAAVWLVLLYFKRRGIFMRV